MGTARHMKIPRPILILIAACLSGFTENEIETAHQWAERTKETLSACLQAEVKNSLTLRIKPADFSIYIKGACVQEATSFRVPFVDYLAMKHPDIDRATHLATAEGIIEQWRNAAVKLYIVKLYIETLYESNN
jgi:hypothetical protein